MKTHSLPANIAAVEKLPIKLRPELMRGLGPRWVDYLRETPASGRSSGFVAVLPGCVSLFDRLLKTYLIATTIEVEASVAGWRVLNEFCGSVGLERAFKTGDSLLSDLGLPITIALSRHDCAAERRERRNDRANREEAYETAAAVAAVRSGDVPE